MDLAKIADEEGLDILGVFVRAARLFSPTTVNPYQDMQYWEQGAPEPNYIRQYVHHWERLNEVDTNLDLFK